MIQDTEYHVENIVCPGCESVEPATVWHYWPFNSYVHTCDQCGHIIMESEWELAKD